MDTDERMSKDGRRCGLCGFFKLGGERRKNTLHCTGKRGRPKADPYDPACLKYKPISLSSHPSP